jgi:hypothetical protein
MAEEWAAREAAPGSAKPRALKGIGVSHESCAVSLIADGTVCPRDGPHGCDTARRGTRGFCGEDLGGGEELDWNGL